MRLRHDREPARRACLGHPTSAGTDLGAVVGYKGATGYAFPYGDYFEMGMGPDGRKHVIWADGKNYIGPGETRYTRGQ